MYTPNCTTSVSSWSLCVKKTILLTKSDLVPTRSCVGLFKGCEGIYIYIYIYARNSYEYICISILNICLALDVFF
jgi:hypothetical protein